MESVTHGDSSDSDGYGEGSLPKSAKKKIIKTSRRTTKPNGICKNLEIPARAIAMVRSAPLSLPKKKFKNCKIESALCVQKMPTL